MQKRGKQLKNPWLLGEHFIDLSDILKTNTSLAESLQILCADLPGAKWEFLRTTEKEVASGKTFSEALAQNARSMPRFCIDILNKAELEGSLPDALRSLGSYMEGMNRFNLGNRQMLKLLIYPGAVFTLGMGVLLLLMLYVVPQFKELYVSFGADLPGLTLAIIQLSEFLTAFWWLLVLVFVSLFWGRRLLAKKFSFFLNLPGRLALNTPFFCRAYRITNSADVARTLGYSLSQGNSLEQALDATAEAVNRDYTRSVIANIKGRIANGKSFGDAVAGEPILTQRLRATARVGERNQQLDRLLSRTADFYTDKLDTAVVQKLVEPLLIIILGSMIGLIVIAMYLPIFKLSAVA